MEADEGMSNFILSPRAEKDLQDILEYIAQDSIDASDRVREDFHSAMTVLNQHPGMGHIRADLSDKPFRYWHVHSYLIVYRGDASPIEIVRVLSGYRDISGLL